MFEKYTEKARRVIFFARYEASQFGQPHIETEHLLLGLLREDKALTNRFLRSLRFGGIDPQTDRGHTTIRESSFNQRGPADFERVQASAGICRRGGGAAGP